MRPFALFLLLLGACTHYPDDCDRRALNEVRTIDRLIDTTRRDIARGYGYETVETGYRTGLVLCSGSRNMGFCAANGPRYVERPVAIDPEAEQRKLDLLRERRAEIAPRAATCQPL